VLQFSDGVYTYGLAVLTLLGRANLQRQHVRVLGMGYPEASIAHKARWALPDAVDGLGQLNRQRGFAYVFRPNQQIGVMEVTAVEGMLQHADCRAMAVDAEHQTPLDYVSAHEVRVGLAAAHNAYLAV